MKTDDNLVLVEPDVVAGHQGKSGRFSRLWQESNLHSFLYIAMGLDLNYQQLRYRKQPAFQNLNIQRDVPEEEK